MALTAMVTTLFWWFLTPESFLKLLDNGTLVITIILLLFGFTVCYWQMIKSPVSQELVNYMIPAILSLSGMSIATREIASFGTTAWSGITYYLTIAVFVSGSVNACWYVRSVKPGFSGFFRQVFSPRMIRIGFYVVSFSAALITAKNLALRTAPNPGYVIALLLTSPLFVFGLNKYNKIPDDISIREGFLMIAFLAALMILVTGNFGVND